MEQKQLAGELYRAQKYEEALAKAQTPKPPVPE
jgi:hypothetical protein